VALILKRAPIGDNREDYEAGVVAGRLPGADWAGASPLDVGEWAWRADQPRSARLRGHP
jgi:hypothetical protein